MKYPIYDYSMHVVLSLYFLVKDLRKAVDRLFRVKRLQN